MRRSNKKYQPERTNRTPSRKRRPGMPLLVILIIALAGTGLYLIFEPVIGRWRQDQASQKLIDSFESGDGTIVIGYNEFIVSGEDYDDYEELVETSAETNQPTETSSATETASTTENSQPTETTPPTPTPATVVIKAIGRIQIPSISVNMPVAEGATLHNLRVAIGHYTNSPSAGEPGVAIFLGHRSYTYGRHFNRMDEVVIGNKIVIETKTHRYTYEVDQIDIVEPAALLYEFNDPTKDPRIMLVTCTPLRVASHRMLVKGALVQTERIG